MKIVAKEFEIIDIWVGRFVSEADADAFFEESFTEEGDSTSTFARQMRQDWYDQDFVERSYLNASQTDLPVALRQHSFSSSYAQPAATAAGRLRPFNSVLLVWNKEIEQPLSVEGEQFELQYIGRFDCDPKAPSL